MRENPVSAIHVHRHPAQSWVLVGEASDQRFTMKSVDRDPNYIAHTRFFRNHDRDDGQLSGDSTGDALEVREDGSPVCLSKTNFELYRRDGHYTVRMAASMRWLSNLMAVEPDAIYAESFLLESNHHVANDTRTLKPTSRQEAFKTKTSSECTVPDYARMIGDLRSWEYHEAVGLGFSNHGDWEKTLRSCCTALHICRNNV